ncbi:uncharacterized protein CMU_006860 [Cryptosporidium muris RN66]|uniref:Uncharacterized protein n=1 Tax=Cryptosporidium muris (strain RN66) TaxID=441375 RepID=B6AHR8_CRYMR|nr:uncharacterized protein CMU_006860 [Cryptosporidium muris RN66]EEA07763.1 hypothetical protein, conserved [Cryptosporidium muris RN66]|eukprot:XP_002142112.1 hypothetical protein [Cryptosporidium muris RN66]
MWEDIKPVWGTGLFEKFYYGPFRVVLSTHPEESDSWWDSYNDCIIFIDEYNQYLNNPFYALPRDTSITLTNVSSSFEPLIKSLFPSTYEILMNPSIIRMCEDISVELPLHQLEVFGFLNLAIMDPLLKKQDGSIDTINLPYTITELFYRERKFLLLIIYEMARNIHTSLILGVLCDNSPESNSNLTSPSHSDSNIVSTIFTSQCNPLCVYGCAKILMGGFVINVVNSIFHCIQAAGRLGPVQNKAESQSAMADIPLDIEVNNTMRSHYKDIINRLTDTIALLLARFHPKLEEIESMMELIPNIAKMHPSFLTNRPTAADYDSWNESKDNSSLSLSMKILFIIIVSFDTVAQRWTRSDIPESRPNSLYNSIEWYFSTKRLPKSNKQNLFICKNPLIHKLLQDHKATSSDSDLSLTLDKSYLSAFWDEDTQLGKFAAFSINGIFGKNSQKRFLGITHWKVFDHIQLNLMPRLHPLEPVNLIFLQVIYDFYLAAFNPIVDPIQWSRILQLQRRVLMDKGTSGGVSNRSEQKRSNSSENKGITSILSPIICCLDVLCRRYPPSSWGASKILSSCIEMFPTLSMYSSYNEIGKDTSILSMSPILLELFIDLLNLAGTIMTVGHYSLGQQISHLLQNQPSNIWFHLPSIIQFLAKVISKKLPGIQLYLGTPLLALEDPNLTPANVSIWNGSGLDSSNIFHTLCGSVLRIIASGFSNRLLLSHPPPNVLLNPVINLNGDKLIVDVLITLFRDSSDNGLFENQQLLYSLYSGCLDAFSMGLIHIQTHQMLQIISQKINQLSRTLQFAIQHVKDYGEFAVKILSCILTLLFRNSQIEQIKIQMNIENLNSPKDSNYSFQLPLLRWILSEILPILDSLDNLPSIRYWRLSTLILKYMRFILCHPLPQNIEQSRDNSEATIWLFRCLLSIDSPTYHQVMHLITLHRQPHLIFLKGSSSDPCTLLQIQTASVGLDLLRILFQRDYIFISWVRHYKSILHHQYLANSTNIQSKDTEFDSSSMQTLDTLAYANSALIPIDQQLNLPPLSGSSNLPNTFHYKGALLEYFITGVDEDILKNMVYILYQLVIRDYQGISALFHYSPSLLLQVKSCLNHILVNPSNDKFPFSIESFVSELSSSFLSIWASPYALTPVETEVGSITRTSLVSDEQATFWEEIAEIDSLSTKLQYNFLGCSSKSLLPINSQLELYWNLYQNALIESYDLSLWLSLRNSEINSPLFISSSINDHILNGYLQNLAPIFQLNKSFHYEKLSRFHLTSIRSLIVHTLNIGLEQNYIICNGLLKRDSSATAVPLMLGLYLDIVTDVPTINEYLSPDLNNISPLSTKSYEEIYAGGPLVCDDGLFPLLTIISLTSNPPQIPLLQPGENKIKDPTIDFTILTQMELYYVCLRLVVNLLKIPQTVDFTIRLILNYWHSRYSILKERLATPVNWIPLEYRWCHYLHITLLIHIHSIEIFIVSEVTNTCLTYCGSLENNKFETGESYWLMNAHNLQILNRIFLFPSRTGSTVTEPFDILAVLFNVGQTLLDDLELGDNYQISLLLNTFIPFFTSPKLLACMTYFGKSMYSKLPQFVINNKFSGICSPSIHTMCCHALLSEYVQFFGLLLQHYSGRSLLRSKDYKTKDTIPNINFTLHSLIELCRPYLNISFLQKSPIPISTAILSIFSQSFLTLLQNIDSSRLASIGNISFNGINFNNIKQSNSTIAIIQDCCKNIIELLCDLETLPKLPLEWKSTLMFLFTSCIALDWIHESKNLSDSSSNLLLQHIWPDIWVKSTKQNSISFQKFISILISNLDNFQLISEDNIPKLNLNWIFPHNLNSKSVCWIYNPFESISNNGTGNFGDKFGNRTPLNNIKNNYKSKLFYPDLLAGIENVDNYFYFSAYSLFLIYAQIHQYKDKIMIEDFQVKYLVPYYNGDRHIQIFLKLLQISQKIGKFSINIISLWNHITAFWLNMSPIFLRRLLETNYIDYLLNVDILLDNCQDFIKCISQLLPDELMETNCTNIYRYTQQSDMLFSFFSLIYQITEKGVLPDNILGGYGSKEALLIIGKWITKFEAFFSAILDNTIKYITFSLQSRRSTWTMSDPLQPNEYGSELLSLLIPLLNPLIMTASKIVRGLNQKKLYKEYSDNTKDIIIGMLHNKCTQILLNLSQNIFIVKNNFKLIYTLMFSCMLWLDTDIQDIIIIQSEYLTPKQIKFGQDIDKCKENFPPFEFITLQKRKNNLAKCISMCINNLVKPLKDDNYKTLLIEKNYLQDIIMIITSCANILWLSCNGIYQISLDKLEHIDKNNLTLFNHEDQLSDIIKTCMESIHSVVNVKDKSDNSNKILESMESTCNKELQILKSIVAQLESLIN